MLAKDAVQRVCMESARSQCVFLDFCTVRCSLYFDDASLGYFVRYTLFDNPWATMLSFLLVCSIRHTTLSNIHGYVLDILYLTPSANVD